MGHPRSRQSGYVLIFTLLVLMIAAVALAASARHTVSRGLEANRSVREQQDRWTSLTAHRVLLPRAEDVLLSDNTQTSRASDLESDSPAERRVITELNGRSAVLVFTDEQAKLNVNALYARAGPEESAQAVRRLSRDSVSAHFIVDLHPVTVSLPASGSPQFFGAYGQVWRYTGPHDLLASSASEDSPFHRRPGLADRITCWGDGRVNLRRASRDTLTDALRGSAAAGLADSLVRLRADHPHLTIADSARRLQLDRTRRLALEDRLSDGSACHGLWVISSDNLKSRYALAVADAHKGGRAAYHRWVWP